MKLAHVALDGTKVRANASKHRATSYQRMKEKEAQLQGEVDELLRRAHEVDEEEDRRYGKYPPTPVITRQRPWPIYTPWAPTPSSRRKRPATVTNRRPHPEDASSTTCLPKTGCAASCRPNEVARDTRCAWRRWSPSSARSSRAEASGSSCCGDWRRCRASGR